MANESTASLLIELGCEELPPLSVDVLREALFSGIAERLEKANVSFDRESSRSFSTPRRLAVLLGDVAARQPDQVIERRGPAVSAAFDQEGKPTPAARGFARSMGMEVEDLEQIENEKGAWLFCRQQVQGKPLEALLFDIMDETLRQLPVPRPMRWSDHEFSFVRPVHWLVVLHGTRVLEGTALGQQAGRVTRGHRIHSPGPHPLESAEDYEATLLQAQVIADAGARRARIVEALEAADGNVILDDALLNEVNNLVEWPVAVACRFDEAFLEVPHEALIASMQDHQKFFPIRARPDSDEATAISNRFLAISNIESTDVDQVRQGYERVIRPRLADARFFLEQDEKTPLVDFAPLLDSVVFQEKIGTIGDKSRRVSDISRKIANFLGIDPAPCARAALLCKCDLMTQMVGEFPELQGIMGAHYARASGESLEVAQAVGEHYSPRFAGDDIPGSAAGQVVSLADRADTLVGIFAAGLAPTGNKDPFALRRGALGLIRILSEARLQLGPATLLSWAAESLSPTQPAANQVLGEVESFVVQRARNHYRECGYATELISAVLASPWMHVPDLEARLEALNAFMGREEARSLAAANKRIGNILRKAGEETPTEVHEDVLELDEERTLLNEINEISDQIKPFLANYDYPASLEALATLRAPVDAFFDTVLVMDEDEQLRRNRLAVLARLKALFDNIADLSVLA